MSQTAMLNQITSGYPTLYKGRRLIAIFSKLRFRTAGRQLAQADLQDKINGAFGQPATRETLSGPPQLDRFLQRIDR